VLDLFDLPRKRALVTGGSSGIGKRVALAYAKRGQVAIAARISRHWRRSRRDRLRPPGEVVPVRCTSPTKTR